MDIISECLKIIEHIEKLKISVRDFIALYRNKYFSETDMKSLIAPENNKYSGYSEKEYIFLIGSYMYFNLYNKPVTWFERRRYAKFNDDKFETFFRKTLCIYVPSRFENLDEMKRFMKILSGDFKNMRYPLLIKSQIMLREINTEKFFNFIIEDIIGTGSSCIVYTASYTDKENNKFLVRLKEFYPSNIEIVRNGNNLEVSDEDKKRFEILLENFSEGYKKQLLFHNIQENMNTISNIQGIYEGNNTKYTAMSCQNGKCLSEISGLAFYDIARLIKTIAISLNNLHNQGYVYLDLKPENIFIYPETPEMIMLFDFDSAIKKEDILKYPEMLSFTEKWSAPEVRQRKYSKISEKSDIYSAGAVLMYLLFNRCPEISDRRYSATWENDINNSIIADESPEFKKMITDIFQRTLSADTNKRYNNFGELIEILDNFIISFQKEKPYLKTFIPVGNNYFCGRNNEMAEIHDILQNETKFLVLHGIGGIGKSELAKHYAMRYSEFYDSVIFIRYNESIISTVADDINFPVMNFYRDEDESEEEYFKRKISILRKICTERNLIILDNFDTDECDNLDELTSLPCRFIVTSRVDFSGIFSQYETYIIEDYNNLYDMFLYYYKYNIKETDEEYIEDIIYSLQGHTMAVELVAKHMNMSEISPSDMYNKLIEYGISCGNSKIRNLKDGKLKSRTAYEHIEILFNVFGLSENIKNILRNMALIGSNPIEKQYFIELNESDENDIKYLDEAIAYGWIGEYESENETSLLMHPLIAETLCRQLKPDSQKCRILAENMSVIADNINIYPAELRNANIRFLNHAVFNLGGEDMTVISFFEKMILIYMHEQNYKNAELCCNRILDIAEKNYPDEISKILNAYFFLMDISLRTENYQKSDKYRNKLSEMGFDRDYAEICCLNFIENQDYNTAEIYAQQLLELSENSHDLYNTYAYFVMIAELKADIEKIREYAETEIEYIKKYISENNFEENSKDIAELYHDLGRAYYSSGKYEKSIEFYEKYIDMAENVMGEKNPDTIDAYMMTGMAYVLSGDTENGYNMCRTACEIAEKYYGAEHSETQYYIDAYNKLTEKSDV